MKTYIDGFLLRNVELRENLKFNYNLNDFIAIDFKKKDTLFFGIDTINCIRLYTDSKKIAYMLLFPISYFEIILQMKPINELTLNEYNDLLRIEDDLIKTGAFSEPIPGVIDCFLTPTILFQKGFNILGYYNLYKKKIKEFTN